MPEETQPPVRAMRIKVTFYSYFKDLTGCSEVEEELPDRSTVRELVERLEERFPKLLAMRKSTLIAVGLDYVARDYPLKERDEVSLFPPVQGG